MRRSIVLASLVASLALAPAMAGDTKEGLGWKFTKGEKVRYGVTYNLELKLEVMGMVQNIHQNARLELTQETKEIGKDGVASIEATLDRVQIEVELPAMLGGGGKIDFDSDKKVEKKEEKKKKADDDDDDEGGGGGGMPGMGKLPKDAFDGLKDIVGSKFTFKIARDGTISDLEGVEEIAQKATAKLGPMGGMAGGAAGTAFPLLDPEVLHQTLDLHCHVFPSEAGGESWEVPTKIQIPGAGTMEFKRKIALKGEDKLVQTAGKPEIKPAKVPAGGGNPMMAQLGKPTIKDPAYEGTSTFSKEKGRVTGDELVATLTSELSVDNPMGGGKGGGDDDEDEDAPKKKDEKKKDDKKKKGDDDEDEDAPKGKGGMKLKVVQKYKIVLKYDLLTGEKKADEKKSDEKKSDEKKSDEKKDKDF